MGDLVFHNPFAFIILPLFIICEYFCKPKEESIFFPHLWLLTKSSIKNNILKLFKWIAIVCLVVAFSGPTLEEKLEEENKDGYSIAILLDASGSMKYGFDMFSDQSKFAAAKEMLTDFIEKRGGDNMGLVVFGNYAYIASPLTYDLKVLKDIAKNIWLGIAGANETRIYEALFQGTLLFKNSKSKEKIIILLTDGESNNDEIPLEAALKSLKDREIKVYAIGIGDERAYNKKVLELLAKETNGKAYGAKNKNDMALIYQEIDLLEKSQIDAGKFIKKDPLFEYFLFLGVLSLLFYIYLVNKRGKI